MFAIDPQKIKDFQNNGSKLKILIKQNSTLTVVQDRIPRPTDVYLLEIVITSSEVLMKEIVISAAFHETVKVQVRQHRFDTRLFKLTRASMGCLKLAHRTVS